MKVRMLTGDCREVVRTLQQASFDCCITDPPYGDTSLDWDKRCHGWIELVASVLKPAASIWVFGSMRSLPLLFKTMADQGFKFSQDIVWEKQNGSGFHADRFRRVHEHAVMFYRGEWRDVYRAPQHTMDARAKVVRRKKRPTHTGHTEAGHYTSIDGGPRLMRSVLRVRNEHGRAIHPTQKPIDIVRPLLAYSCPIGGSVIDPFAGSGTTGLAALDVGCDATLIEIDAAYADGARRRLGLVSEAA